MSVVMAKESACHLLRKWLFSVEEKLVELVPEHKMEQKAALMPTKIAEAKVRFSKSYSVLLLEIAFLIYSFAYRLPEM